MQRARRVHKGLFPSRIFPSAGGGASLTKYQIRMRYIEGINEKTVGVLKVAHTVDGTGILTSSTD